MLMHIAIFASCNLRISTLHCVTLVSGSERFTQKACSLCNVNTPVFIVFVLGPSQTVHTAISVVSFRVISYTEMPLFLLFYDFLLLSDLNLKYQIFSCHCDIHISAFLC